MTPAQPVAPRVSRSPIEEAAFAILSVRGPGKTICPSEVARAVDPQGWRLLLAQVRATAVGLARVGRLEITRHGKTVDPSAFKGVYRLRLPPAGPAPLGGGKETPE